MKHATQSTTGWDHISRWYDRLVGERGHRFHAQLIIPRSLQLLSLRPGSSLLDVACGQGILARSIPHETRYLGIDGSKNLIHDANSRDHNPLHKYLTIWVDRPFTLPQTDFTHAAIILALQNIRSPEITISETSRHLVADGKLLIVLNHPCFRIPRQSAWGIDPSNKLQYRRINRYMSRLEIPIDIHPGKTHTQTAWSYHYPLTSYSQMLQKANLVIEQIEEWTSDKTSQGPMARSENRGRSEFPLFMAILCTKKSSK